MAFSSKSATSMPLDSNCALGDLASNRSCPSCRPSPASAVGRMSQADQSISIISYSNSNNEFPPRPPNSRYNSRRYGLLLTAGTAVYSSLGPCHQCSKRKRRRLRTNQGTFIGILSSGEPQSKAIMKSARRNSRIGVDQECR